MLRAVLAATFLRRNGCLPWAVSSSQSSECYGRAERPRRQIGGRVANSIFPVTDQDTDHLLVEPVPSCPTEIGASLWTLQEARRRTLSYVDGISQEALDHTPPGHRHSVATLLYHIAVFEVDWLYVDILGAAYDEERLIPICPPEVGDHLPYPILTADRSYTPVAGEPIAVHVERLSVIRADFLDVLTRMSVEEFRRERSSGDALVTPEWVIEHLAQHEAEHRGQIWEARLAAEATLGMQSLEATPGIEPG
jgi:uncharacterized damage-inducible protein DinB